MKLAAFSKTFDGVKVLNFPGLELTPGKIYGVIGANGSGKSTFARILAGILPADKKGRHHDAASLGYLPQKNYGFRMTAKANLLLSARDEKRAGELMEALQITCLAKKPGHRLSGGETARMALARLMMKPYDLMILDEPTAAMDMEATALTEQLIREYVTKTGCALLLVTHSLQQARRLADEVLYFHKGELVEHGPADRVLDGPADKRTKRFLNFYGI